MQGVGIGISVVFRGVCFNPSHIVLTDDNKFAITDDEGRFITDDGGNLITE